MVAHGPGGKRSTVVCVGEPLVVLAPTEGRLRSSDFVEIGVAGAELNVAIHLARLGVASRYVSRIGDDPFGDRLRDTLIDAGVEVDHLATDPVLPTGLYAKDPAPGRTTVHYYRAGSAASAMTSVPRNALAGADLVHLTGILPVLSASCRRLSWDLLEGPIPTSFDVNHRPTLWSAADAAAPLLELARSAGTVFVGLDEAEQLWRTSTPADVRDLLPAVPELVVKDGAKESVAFHEDEVVTEPALRVPVVEPVGAGDAFAGGYLAGRLSGLSLAASLRQGHAMAAATLGVHGDQGTLPEPGLLDAVRSGRGWPRRPAGT